MDIMQDVSVGVLGLEEVWRSGLKRISKKIRVFLPGETLAMNMNEHPVIISTVMLKRGEATVEKMVIAHTGNISIVNDIIAEFRKDGVPPRGITMYIQECGTRKGVPFLNKAICAGILQVWTSSQIDDFLEKLGIAIEDERLLTVRRKTRTQ